MYTFIHIKGIISQYSNLEIFISITTEETTPLAVCKYIRENIDKEKMYYNGFHFNAIVNNSDFFSGHIYGDGGTMYWGTIMQRTGSIESCQMYKYFSSGGADSVTPFSGNVNNKILLAYSAYNNDCRNKENVQPDYYNTGYINISDDNIISFTKTCSIVMIGYCQSHVNNGSANPFFVLNGKTIDTFSRDNTDYFTPIMAYADVKSGDTIAFHKYNQFQLDASNGYGYVVMLKN